MRHISFFGRCRSTSPVAAFLFYSIFNERRRQLQRFRDLGRGAAVKLLTQVGVAEAGGEAISLHLVAGLDRVGVVG